MNIINIKTSNNWLEIKNCALMTVGIQETDKEPTSEWKKKILLAEHSPIRKLKISWTWIDIPYWVSVHFVRHKIGIEHFVRTQRTDRILIDRDKLSQGQLIEHHCEANAQAIINISRKRLCNLASKETREAWEILLKGIKFIEPELYSCCVSDCIYRGGCKEFKSCGLWEKTIKKEINNILDEKV